MSGHAPGVMKERGNTKLRRLDALGGVPLLLFLRLCKRRRTLPHPARSVGILRTSCIGDTVLLSAIVADLRAALPGTKLRFFAGDTNFDTARLFMREDEVRRIRVTSPIATARTIRREELDVLLDFGPWPRIDALIAALAGARCLIGYQTPRQFRHYCYDIAVKHSSDVHELVNYRQVARALGIVATHEPHLVVEDALVLNYSNYVVFHLWPGGYLSHLREWPEESWLQLARQAAGEGFSIVLTGTKSDRQRNQALVAQMPASVQVCDVAGQFDLADTAQLLKQAAAVVSVNTGIMHLSAAIGTPTVGISGPTSVARWGAVGPRVCNVAPDAEGCGYLNLGFEYRGQRVDCMEQISVASVWAGLQQVTAAAAGRVHAAPR
jgi:ADP-heptose:LPS heptosyltransferase